MTQKYHHSTCRAALSIAAAATTFIASHAGAQMLGSNIFSGTNTSPTSLSTPTLLAGTGQTNSGFVGPGFMGTVVLPVGALDVVTETVNAGGNGMLTAGETGPGVLGLPIAAGVGGTFVATKALQANFVPNQSYSFTLTTTSNAQLNLLTGLNVIFSTQGATPATVYSLSGGSGLLGIVNVLNLFNGTSTATFNFMAPANVDTTVPITFTVSGTLTASALNNSFTLSGATLNAVPEPGTVGAMGVGIAALAMLRFRHRLARN